MSKLYPGMLAIIIGCRFTATQQNIGKTVEILEIWPDSEVLVKGETLTDKDGTIVPQALCRPNHLMPIPPLSDPLETKQEQELHA